MPDDRATRVAEIVKSALDCSGAERAALLARECSTDLRLREEVSSLLEQQEGLDDFLETNALHLCAESFDRDADFIGQKLGQYEILSLIARGGMGEVYLAQDHELNRQVALKLVRQSFGSSDFARQLRREARILARLNDPHIARLYGGAVTPTGQPYFIMEYVEGLRLDEFCDTRRLPINQRIELFRKVCSAVAYAHQHLVIHRDLKPANIRVTPDGAPKLLDFGIAKLLEPELTNVAATITLAHVMTPEYASPEQARGETMTTASDIYSLGVVLYELLTGQKPYRIANHSAHEVARTITDTPLTPPSVHRAELAGDLDNILLLALRKEPERRYASVGQFSEDLRRYLAGLPVFAHKDTAIYRAKKFVRRNRAVVVTALFLALALLAGLATTTWQARLARRAQRKAEAASKQADGLNQFLEDLLASADPANAGQETKVAPVLDAAAEKLDREMAGEPQILLRAHDTLRRAYQHLGLFEKAEQQARATLDLSRRLHGPEDPATARAEFALGDVLSDRYKPKEAQPLLRHALAVQRRQLPPDHSALAETLDSLSFLFSSQNKPKEAKPLADEALAQARLGWPPDDPRRLRLLSTTSTIIIANRDYAAAEPVLRNLIQLNDKLHPGGGLGALAPEINLCIALFNEDKLAELEPQVTRLQNDCRRLVGEHGIATAIATAVRGILDFARGNYEAAIPSLKSALETLSGSYPPNQITVVQCEALLGLCLTRTGRAAEGEPFLRTAFANGRELDRADFAHTFGNLENALAECLLAQPDRIAEARPLLASGYEDLKTRLGPENRLTITAGERLRDLQKRASR